MLATQGISVQRHRIHIVRTSWRMIVNPRRFRRSNTVVTKARVIYVLAQIIARLSHREVLLLSSYFCGIMYDDINTCVMEVGTKEELTALMVGIRAIFECVDCTALAPEIALDFFEAIYQDINAEDRLATKLQLTIDQAKALAYFCRVLSPEEVL